MILLIGLAVRVDYSLFYIAARAHTNNAGLTALPPNLEIAKTSERIQEAFPGGPQPAYVVAEAPDVGAAPVRAAVAELRRRALASASSAIRSGWTSTTTASSSPSASRSPVPAQARGPSAPLALLRKRLVPETVDRVPGVEVGIGGLTAELKDFTDLLGRRAPLLFAFVLGLAFLLLMDAFRSTVVAAKAVRSVLVPAAMKLLGRWNWYPPRWLERLPRPSRAPVSASAEC